MFVTRRKRRARVEITPLIDVIFSLLVFFMIFSSFDVDRTSIDIELPKAATASAQQSSSITISINKSGTMHIDGKAVNVRELQSRVKQAIEKQPNTFVIIKADKETRYDNVVRAMDAVRSVGGHRLGLAVERTE
ncbi:MAG: ExbD/TolR family protein [Limnochordia bacterium]|jgi:biopolymer transport protein ExbD